MAIDLKAIRLALKAALEKGLGTEDQQISAYVLRNPNFPTVWVRPKPDTPIEYHQAMGNGVQFWYFLVEAYCGSNVDVVAQETLDAYLSDGGKSIVAALEADLTLGGVVQNLVVRNCQSYVEFKRGDDSLGIGANWLVEIYP